MYSYKYVENEQMQIVLSFTKSVIFNVMKQHFKDKSKNRPLPFEFCDDNRVIMNFDDLSEIEKVYQYFQEHPQYGQAVSEQEAKTLQQEFE